MEHFVNQPVEVLIYDSKTRKSNWKNRGEIKAIISATDRRYRLNVQCDDGALLEACAPECVRPLKA